MIIGTAISSHGIFQLETTLAGFLHVVCSVVCHHRVDGPDTPIIYAIHVHYIEPEHSAIVEFGAW